MTHFCNKSLRGTDCCSPYDAIIAMINNAQATADAALTLAGSINTSLNNILVTVADAMARIDALGTVMTYKGSVATYADLPATGNEIGDTWNVIDTGNNYAWTGTAWDQLGSVVDLSPYLKITDAASTYLTITNAASTYQPLLVSGTNIKTINSQDIIGTGNIDIMKGWEYVGQWDRTYSPSAYSSASVAIASINMALGYDYMLFPMCNSAEISSSSVGDTYNSPLTYFYFRITNGGPNNYSVTMTFWVFRHKRADNNTGTFILFSSIQPNQFQLKLKDAIDIKTIGSQSILGSGNIDVRTIGGESIFGSGNIAVPTSTYVPGYSISDLAALTDGYYQFKGHIRFKNFRKIIIDTIIQISSGSVSFIDPTGYYVNDDDEELLGHLINLHISGSTATIDYATALNTPYSYDTNGGYGLLFTGLLIS